MCDESFYYIKHVFRRIFLSNTLIILSMNSESQNKKTIFLNFRISQREGTFISNPLLGS